MKTYHLKDLLKKELLILELPRVCDYKLTKEMIFIMDKERSTIHRFKASYTLLGKPDEIKEEDAMELVEIHPNWQPANDFYIDYKNKDSIYEHKETATESLLSAVESVIYWDVNPIKKPNGEDYYYEENHGFDGVETLWDGGSYNEDLGQFEEAELRTFDRSRTLIFVKN